MKWKALFFTIFLLIRRKAFYLFLLLFLLLFARWFMLFENPIIISTIYNSNFHSNFKRIKLILFSITTTTRLVRLNYQPFLCSYFLWLSFPPFFPCSLLLPYFFDSSCSALWPKIGFLQFFHVFLMHFYN